MLFGALPLRGETLFQFQQNEHILQCCILYNSTKNENYCICFPICNVKILHTVDQICVDAMSQLM